MGPGFQVLGKAVDAVFGDVQYFGFNVFGLCCNMLCLKYHVRVQVIPFTFFQLSYVVQNSLA